MQRTRPEGTTMPFDDRVDAGKRLARELGRFAAEDPVVLGLPRGGVVVAAEVARALHAPLDVMCVRKVGVPGHEELGMGAVAEGGTRFLDHAMIEELGVPDAIVERLVERKTAEVEDRARRFAGRAPRPSLAGKTVLLVDDGIATGGTVRAAARAVRARSPARIVLAVPVAPPSTLGALRDDVDEIVALETPEELYAIGMWYSEFAQTEDEEVVELLERARDERGAAAGAP